MATLAAAVSRICDDLSRPEAEIGANVQREILLAVDHYSPERFAFNERILSFTISATDTYELSTIVTGAGQDDVAEVIDPERLRIYINSRFYTLERRPYGETLGLQDSPVISGSPDFWSVFNKKLILDVVPNQTQTGYLYSHVRLTPLDSLSNTENAWLTDGLELICARAASQVCRKKLKDFEDSANWEQIELSALNALRFRASKMSASGNLLGSW